MTRTTLPVLTVVALGLHLGGTSVVAQQTPADAAPQPQLPPMPSMEGQEGDTGKPAVPAPAKAAKAKAKAPHAPRPGAKNRPGMKTSVRSKPRKPGH